jgi:hypothetical protein
LEDIGKWTEKLENYWAEDERCNGRIREEWSSVSKESQAMYV